MAEQSSFEYRAVLFDLDGTLLNTIEDLANSMNSVLARFGFPNHGIEAYKYFVGEGMENLVRRALPESVRQEGDLAVYVAAMREEYGKRWMEKTRPYGGIPALLDSLAERGIRLAVLSNKPDDFTQAAVARFFSRWRFEHVAGLRQGVPRKPDPAAALTIADRMQISPSAFLYVGDSNIDMETATAAGMFAVGVLWGFRKAEELLASGAKALIAEPKQVLDLL